MLVNDLKAIKESHPILDITPVIDPATGRLERARPCPIAPCHPSRGRLSSAFDLIWQSMWLASLLAGGLLAGAIGIRAVYHSGAALLAAGGYRAASVWSSRKQQQQQPGPSGLRPGRANGGRPRGGEAAQSAGHLSDPCPSQSGGSPALRACGQLSARP